MLLLCRDAVLGRRGYSFGGGAGRRLVELVDLAGSFCIPGGGSGVGVRCSDTFGKSGLNVARPSLAMLCVVG